MRIRRFIVITAAAAAGAALGLGANAVRASAAATPLQVNLSQCGAGSSATFDNTGDVVLTSGTADAGTCGAPAGSTYDPAYAEITLFRMAGLATPQDEPFFDQSSYVSGSGDARFVLDLNNGDTLTGYPPQAGLNGTDVAWAVGNSGTYTSYATAFAAVNGNSTTVKDAYIVDDATDAAAPLTITNLQFNQQTLSSGGFVSVINPSPVSGYVNMPGALAVLAGSDVSDPVLTYSATNLPPGMSINESTGLISGTPTAPGNYQVTETGTNVYGQSGSTSFAWLITYFPWPTPYGLHQTVYATSASLAWGNTGVPASALNNVSVWGRYNHKFATVTSPIAGGHDRATGLRRDSSYCWHVQVAASPTRSASQWSRVTACFKTPR